MSSNQFSERVLPVLVALMYLGATGIACIWAVGLLTPCVNDMEGGCSYGKVLLFPLSGFSATVSAVLAWTLRDMSIRRNWPRRITVLLTVLGLPAAAYAAILGIYLVIFLIQIVTG